MDNTDVQKYHDTINALKAVIAALEEAGPDGFPAIISSKLPTLPLFTKSPLDSIEVMFSIPWGG